MVRLPPYHCELNSIEPAWSQVKTHIKKNNKLFTLSHVKELTYKGFKLVDAEKWGKLIDHVSNSLRTNTGKLTDCKKKQWKGLLFV